MEDLMDLVAMLPWWAGVMLALASYVVLRQLAAAPPPAAVPGQMANLVTGSMVRGLAMVGQYLLPLICLLGALASFLARRKRAALVDKVTMSNSASALNSMSWQEFEQLVGEAFRLQGYTVAETGGGGADGGVDLVLRKGGETFLVQCKQWKAFKVGVDVVRQLYGVMAARGAAGGFVISSGTFTPDAEAFAQGRNLTLVDGSKLLGLIRQAKASFEACRAGPSAASKTPASPAATPVCPKCSAPMVQRTARQGANAGAQFWGCTRFPACRGTR